MKKATFIVRLLAWGAALSFVFSPRVQLFALGILFPNLSEKVYPRAGLPILLFEHIMLAGLASLIAVFFGVLLGVFVTRNSGRDFLPLSQKIVSSSQTFPPVAVIALIVPLLGFGLVPAVVAIALYSVLPVFLNTVSGFESVQKKVIEAARGMGMKDWEILLKIELPLASPIIFAGVRTCVVITIGTATLGAVVGAGGLGVPIIAGLVRYNPSFVLQGAFTSAILALAANTILLFLESKLFPSDDA